MAGCRSHRWRLKTGWAVSPNSRSPQTATFQFAEPITVQTPTALRITMTQEYGDSLTLARFRISTSGADAQDVLPPSEWPESKAVQVELASQQKALSDFDSSLARLPIMRELSLDKNRITKLHNRGNFLDPGPVVQGDVLAAFGSPPPNAPKNRLDVAQWLVSKDNPLTPRVWANRIWARLFGIGIVETEEDFGALGSPPPIRSYWIGWLQVIVTKVGR